MKEGKIGSFQTAMAGGFYSDGFGAALPSELTTYYSPIDVNSFPQYNPATAGAQGLHTTPGGNAIDAQQQQLSFANNRTLYIGNLHNCMDEGALHQVFQACGSVESIKIIKDKVSGISQGYGFIRFGDKQSAEIAMQQFQGYVLYGQEIRLNWAYPSGQREDISLHHHIFVGDLSQEVTDTTLMAAFCRYISCSGARVLWDTNTGRSKGYGFVSFREKEEANCAIAEMNGQLIGGRRVRCGWAQHKQSNMETQDCQTVSRQDPSNTNVYIGNVSAELNDEDIKAHFSRYGDLAEVKLHKKGGYGFVRFQKHEDAVQAIVAMNGITINDKVLKCGWGKKTNNAPNTILANYSAIINANNTATAAALMSPSNVNQMLQQAAYPQGLPSIPSISNQVVMGGNPATHSVLPHMSPQAANLNQHTPLMMTSQLNMGMMNGRGMLVPNSMQAGRFAGLTNQYDSWMA